MQTAHRAAVEAQRQSDATKMSPEKLGERRHNAIVGWTLVGVGVGVILVSCLGLVMSALRTVPVGMLQIVLLVIGIGLAIYGAHVLPSTTKKADAWMQDALESVGGLLPKLKR